MDYRHTRVLTTVESRFIGARWSHGLLTTMTPLSSSQRIIVQIGSTVEPRLMDYRHTRVLTTVESRFIGARWSHGLLTTMTPLSSSQIIIVLFK